MTEACRNLLHFSTILYRFQWILYRILYQATRRGTGASRWAEALANSPHLEFYRLPSYGPQLNVVERFWQLLRRRPMHNRLFEALTELKGSVRNSLRYFQTVRGRLKQLLNGRPRKAR